MTRQTKQHPVARGTRQDEEGRAHHQLRPRRPGRRGGAAPSARIAAMWPARPSTSSSRSRRRRTRCSAMPTSSARRIWAPPPTEAQENVALQVAEQMSDYLIRGAISNAINFPSITAEEAPKLKPFIALAEKLGSFAGQLTESGHQGLRITYEGEVGGDEDEGADRLGDRGPAAAAARGRQRRVGADRGARSAASPSRRRRAQRRATTRSLITLTVADRAARALRRRHGLPRRQAAHHRRSRASRWTPNSRPR